MDYHTLERLRESHPGWRLLTADHAALVVSFLHRAFVEPNVRTISRAELVAKLDDYLHHLRETEGAERFPRAPGEYLDNWAGDAHGWLRKYYPQGTDEPNYDLTSAAQSAIVWLSRIGQRTFVGTESRLMTVLELLRQISQGTEPDPDARIADLEARKAEIEEDIARLRGGAPVEVLDPTQVRDRFQQLAETAFGLLSDFREVEQNLRDLDRRMREQIATWGAGKGALIEEMFGERDAIADSDTGRSFRAFWDFLMAPARQDELTDRLDKVFALEDVQQLHPDQRLRRIHYEWLKAGETTQRTVARLSEQLRRFLDDQAFHESRRIMELVRGIEQTAMSLRDSSPELTMPLEEPRPRIMLPLERPLYSPPFKPNIDDSLTIASDADINADALFEQVYVDKTRLRARIRQSLQLEREVTLASVVDAHPLEQGLAELVAYMSIATDDKRNVIDDSAAVHFSWIDPGGRMRRATLPLVVFRR